MIVHARLGRPERMIRTRAEIRETIAHILREQLNVDAATLTDAGDDTPLLGRGIGIDSFETLALVAGLEEGFGIHIDDAELTAQVFRTLGNVTDLVLAKLTSQGGS